MRQSAFVILAFAAAGLCGCAGEQTPATQAAPQAQAVAAAPAATPTPEPTPDPSLGTLKITDVVLGSGPEAVAGKTVAVNYTGRLITGAQFDSSVGRGPFSFVLGAGQVIKGWDMGVAGMKVGGKRQLVIPPYLGYGAGGMGPIPGNATLVFDVELLGVQ
jgi:FKBP-type peptidyl-prolyl cis-trans isomerase